MNAKNWSWLAGVGLAAVLALGGCAKLQQAKHEKAIRERYAQGITALCKGNYEAWRQVVAPELRQSETKVKLIWAGLRVAASVSQPNPDDFRVDSVYFDAAFTNATVRTSRQTKGEWKPEDKPLQWVRVGETWYVKF